MPRHAPIFGGVRDGDVTLLPINAEEGYQVRLRQNEQSTDYTLRGSGRNHVLVAEGLRWPIIDAAGV